MSTLAAGNHCGDAVTVLWDVDGKTHVGYGEVAAEVPLVVELSGPLVPAEGTDVRVVRDQGDRFVSGSATVSAQSGSSMVLGKVTWEEPNRRVYDRHRVNWTASIRVLDDLGSPTDEQFGVATDVSLGGAAIHLEEPPEVGTLVEIKAAPADGSPMRAVGVIVRRQGNDVGLAFLFLWAAARTNIERLAVPKVHADRMAA